MSIKANYPTVRPSLDLDFANSKRLDRRVTFSRASTATYVDANGTIQTAAANTPRFDHDPSTGESLGLLVEEARTNLWTDSTNFSTTGNRINITATPNAGIAPDGSSTVTWLRESAVTGTFYYYRSIASSAGTYTFTVYAKGDGSGRLLNLTIQLNGAYRQSYFNLSTGVASNVDATLTASCVNAGNGWFKCSVTGTSTSSNSFTPFIYIAAATGESSVYVNRQGNGTSGIYIWGAQLEAGSFPTSHIPTPATFTSRASTAAYYDANGVIQTAGIDVARSAAYFPDSNGVMRPAGLLLEAAATNLVTYSEQFDNAAWTKSSATVTANAAVGPDGNTTAELIYPSTTGSSRGVYTSVSIASSITTMSFFVKASGFTRCVLIGSTSAIAAWFDLSVGTVGTVTSGCSASIQKLANGWFRCSLTQPATTTPYITICPCDADNSFTATASGSNGILVWGAQLESGSYPSSYIPTTSATVTRSADVSSSATVTRSADVAQMTGTSFTSWYNQSQGTVFHTGRFVGDVPTSTYGRGNGLVFRFSNSGLDPFSNQWYLGGYRNNGPSYPAWMESGVYNGTTNQGFLDNAQLFNNPPKSVMRIGAYIDTIAGSLGHILNGGSVTSVAITNTPTWNTLSLSSDYSGGTRCGTIARFAYYPKRLANAQLQSITAN